MSENMSIRSAVVESLAWPFFTYLFSTTYTNFGPKLSLIQVTLDLWFRYPDLQADRGFPKYLQETLIITIVFWFPNYTREWPILTSGIRV
jgi:hypothetical protein